MKQAFSQELKDLMQETIRDVHTVVPGNIISYAPDKCEATVQPTAKFRKPNGELMSFSQIHHVPVYFTQSMGQTATIAYPINPGDECLLLFSEQALDYWRTGQEPTTELRFDLANAIALIGLFSKPNPIMERAQDNESIIIQRKNTFIEIYDDKIDIATQGDVNIKGANINLN